MIPRTQEVPDEELAALHASCRRWRNWTLISVAAGLAFWLFVSFSRLLLAQKQFLSGVSFWAPFLVITGLCTVCAKQWEALRKEIKEYERNS